MAVKTHDIQILYEDEFICVCKKPSGLACESARASGADLVKVLKKKYFLQSPEQGEPYLSLVHRLDQPVGGIMVLARNPMAAAGLSKQIRNHDFVKEYLAVVMAKKGTVPEKGHLEDYLIRDGRTNTSAIVTKQNKQAKKAILDYEILEWSEDREELALVKVTLKTGRHHQIRVQMAAHGMPLVYDQKYNTKCSQTGAEGNTALYAFHLEFTHPKTGKYMKFTDFPEQKPFEVWNENFSKDRGKKFRKMKENAEIY